VNEIVVQTASYRYLKPLLSGGRKSVATCQKLSEIATPVATVHRPCRTNPRNLLGLRVASVWSSTRNTPFCNFATARAFRGLDRDRAFYGRAEPERGAGNLLFNVHVANALRVFKRRRVLRRIERTAYDKPTNRQRMDGRGRDRFR
jgi:hypothetical protein